MRKINPLLLFLFVTFAVFSLSILTQQVECADSYEISLGYGESWEITPLTDLPLTEAFPTTIEWSFVGDNTDVEVTVRWTYTPSDSDSGDLISEGTHQASGKIEERGDWYSSHALVFWHIDSSHIFQSTTLSIQINVTPFYFHLYMILIYVGGVLFLTFCFLCTCVLPIRVARKRRMRKASQQTTISVPVTKQPDPSPIESPPKPTESLETDNIFCWKCGQSNTVKTSFCIKCGSDIHNPER